MKSFKIKKTKQCTHEVWACSPEGETLVEAFDSFFEAAQFMRQILPGLEEGGLPPLPKPSYVSTLREENKRLRAEIKRLKDLISKA